MVIVFFILLILSIICLILIYSDANIEIKGLELETNKIKKLDNKFQINISIGPFNSKFINYTIYEKEIQKIFSKNISKVKFEDFKLNIDDAKNKKIISHLKKANIKLEKLDLRMIIGIEDCVLTAYLVGIISAIISNIIPFMYDPKKNVSSYRYKITPIYNRFFSKLNLNCIIRAKLVHIICIILLIWKGSREYERASNRKSYGYSYE